MKPIKLILDTDIGSDIDDAIALAFALKRPELEILGLTTVYGPVEQRAEIAAMVLKAMGREDIPYAIGDGKPLNGIMSLPGRLTHHERVKAAGKLPAPASQNAQELFRKIIEAHPGEVWLVCIGPLTNAAILIRDHPELAKKLKGISIMGGELTRPLAEYNVRLDAEASDIVFASGMLKYLGTHDVTQMVWMNDADIERLRNMSAPIASVLVDCIKLWKPYAANKPGPVMYDMCPLTWLFAPQLFTTAPRRIRVELSPPERRGILAEAPERPAIDAVTTNMDAAAIHNLLMDTLCV